jgi:hypothetical protein
VILLVYGSASVLQTNDMRHLGDRRYEGSTKFRAFKLGLIMGWANPRVWRAGCRRGGCGFEISTRNPTLTRSVGWRVPAQVCFSNGCSGLPSSLHYTICLSAPLNIIYPSRISLRATGLQQSPL